MAKEIEILREYNIFKVIWRPVDKNIIGPKWVYALKWLKNGDLDKRKAQTVAKGFIQVLEKDYNEHISVMRLELVYLIYTIIAARGLHL